MTPTREGDHKGDAMTENLEITGPDRPPVTVVATNCETVEVNVNHYPEGTAPDLAALLAKIDLLEKKIEALAFGLVVFLRNSQPGLS